MSSPIAETMPTPPARWFKWLRWVAILTSIFVVLQDVETILKAGGVLPAAGAIGIQPSGTTKTMPVRVVVGSVVAGSPAAKAGIEPGDLVRTDPPWQALRAGYLVAGERFELLVQHEGKERSVELVPALAHQEADLNSLRYAVATSITALIGVLILFRAAGRLDAMLLALSLIAFGRPFATPQSYEGMVGLWPLSYAIGLFLNAITYGLFFGFALSFDDRQRGAKWRWAWPLNGLLALGCVIFGGVVWVAGVELWPNQLALFIAHGQATCIPMLPTVAVLLVSRQRVPLAQRRRYTLVLAALVAIFISQLIGFFNWSDRTNSFIYDGAGILGDILSGIVAPAVLAYALLREKVIDLGFAINRTLVFSGVSAVLLLTFGITEWAVEHVLKVEGREANAVIDAGIALGLFLAFHRVQHYVGHVVERLFFHRWQTAEAAFRLFVKRAGFITQRDRLVADFAQAASRFADGAPAAIYLRGEDNRLARMFGDAGAPALLDPDDSAVLAMRADLQPVECNSGKMTGSLLVPMPVRHDIAGVLLMGAKHSSEPYRPDQIALLGWAAEQVGLDLNALEIERLEAMAQQQRGTIAELNAALAAVSRLKSAPA